MGPEALVAAAATLVGFMTWSHQQRQSIINDRFNSIKKRVEDIENKVNEIPATYAMKSELNAGLLDIRDRLNHINDKLDQLILSKINEKI
jgi:tetrahydromethanopterin S-methyltransferase subunit G